MALMSPSRSTSATGGTTEPVATTWLIVFGVMLSAFNLRTAVTSVGPLLDKIQTGLSMSATTAGVLTTLPVIGFAVMGAATPALTRRFGARAVLITALFVMSAGLLVRASVVSIPVFLAASALALAGGAVGNVALPSVVKRYFPHRVGPMTTAYSTSLAIGTMVSAAATVPLERLLGGSWQMALGIWAIPALLAIVPWLALRSLRPNATAAGTPPTPPLKGLARNRFAWTMLLSFGSQSLIAYILFGWLPEMMRDHGYSSAQAGLMLGVFTAIGIPVAVIVPLLAARLRHQRPVLVALVACYVLGMPALWLGGESAVTWIGLLLVGTGMGTFPLMLTLFALRTKTSAGTAGLSAFAQSGGYLIAGIGPLLVGVLYETTGSWTAPFVLLLTAVAVHLVTGWSTTRSRFLEDELTRATAR